MAGAAADNGLVSGLVGAGITCGAAAGAGFLVRVGISAVACSGRVRRCLGRHTKEYQVVLAATALAITLTLKTRTAASPGVGRALMTAAGVGQHAVDSDGIRDILDLTVAEQLIAAHQFMFDLFVRRLLKCRRPPDWQFPQAALQC